MVTTQLVTYIREQQALGRDEETIMKTLMSREWKPQDIQAGFASVGAWNQTFQYVIPGTEQAAEAKPQSKPVAATQPAKKRGVRFGLIAFVLVSIISASVAFYLGRNGTLETVAPSVIPAQSSQTEASSPAPAPPSTPKASF